MAADHKWDDRFLSLAESVAAWSKDPSTKVGAVIVDEKRRVVGLGYNGFPRGVEDDVDRLSDRPTKYALMVHAEANAILNAGRSVEGCTIYVWPTIMVPAMCPSCAKLAAQAGIKRAVYREGATSENWKDQEALSRLICDEAGIRCDMICST